MQQSVEEIIKSRYIGRILRVITLNNRIFQGKLVCVDFKGNLILHEAVAEISDTQNCPLNYEIENIYDLKLKYQHKSDSKETYQQQRNKYMGSHYYFGAIMISGNDIASVKMKQLLSQQKMQNNEQGAKNSQCRNQVNQEKERIPK